MSKILDTELYKYKKQFLCIHETYINSVASQPYICGEAVKLALGKIPQDISLKVYTKNPKRKNTIHVVRDCYREGEDRYYYEWKGEFTPAWKPLEDVISHYKEVWIVIKER